MKKVFILLFTLYILPNLIGQDIHQEHSKQALLEDFKQFRKLLEKHHAGLYVFQSKEEFTQKMDSLQQNINTMSELDFYKILRKIIVSIREKHTEIGGLAGDKTSNIGKVFKEKKAKSIPLILAFRPNDKAYIYANASPDSTILEESEILSINGESITEIHQKIFPYIITDGNIKISKYDQMNASVRYYYHLLVNQTEDFEVKYKDKNDIKTVQLKGLNIDSINKWVKNRYPDIVKEFEKNNLYKLKYEEDYETAIFTLSSFSKNRFKKEKLAYKTFFKSVFDTIQNHYQAKNLVIDLRRNRGGRIRYMFELLSYLTTRQDKPLVYENKKAHKQKWHKTKLKRVQDNPFKGNIYILVGPRTFSAGVMLAVFSKEFANAKIVGQETGGRYNGTTAGSSKFFILKNTKIRIRIPIYLYRYKVKQQIEGRGVMPDYEVPASVNNVKIKDDPALNKILEWIKTQ